MTESQATLVDPSPPFTLLFTKDSVLNTTVESDSRLLYIVSTDVIIGNRTTISDANGRVSAVIHRRDVLADTVSFPLRGNKTTKLKNWLVPHTCTDRTPVHLLDTPLGRCMWKHDSVWRLALYRLNADPTTPPIGYLLPSSMQTGRPLCLVVESSYFSIDELGHISLNDATTREFMEDIVVSALILELQLRIRENDAIVCYA